MHKISEKTMAEKNNIALIVALTFKVSLLKSKLLFLFYK